VGCDIVADPRKTIDIYRKKNLNYKKNQNNDNSEKKMETTSNIDDTVYTRQMASKKRLQERNDKALRGNRRNSVHKIIRISEDGIETGGIDIEDLKKIKEEAESLLDLF